MTVALEQALEQARARLAAWGRLVLVALLEQARARRQVLARRQVVLLVAARRLVVLLVAARLVAAFSGLLFSSIQLKTAARQTGRRFFCP